MFKKKYRRRKPRQRKVYRPRNHLIYNNTK